jgi:hypothetical protein
MHSWMTPSFNDTVIEIGLFADLNTVDLLTDAVVNRSDAVISHSEEVGKSF